MKNNYILTTMVRLFDRSLKRILNLAFDRFVVKLPNYDDKMARKKKQYIRSLLSCSIEEFKEVVSLSAQEPLNKRSYTLEIDLLNALCQTEGYYRQKIFSLLTYCPELYHSLPAPLKLDSKIIQYVVQINPYIITQVDPEEMSWLYVLSAVSDHNALKDRCLTLMMNNGPTSQAVGMVVNVLGRSGYTELKNRIEVLEDVVALELTDRQNRIRIKLDSQFSGTPNHDAVIYKVLSDNPYDIQYIPREYLGHGHYMKSLSAHGDMLRMINPESLSVEHRLHAVSQNGLSLRYMHDHILDSSIYRAALAENWQALFYMPHHWLIQHPNEILELMRKHPDNQFEMCVYPSMQAAVNGSALFRYVIQTEFPLIQPYLAPITDHYDFSQQLATQSEGGALNSLSIYLITRVLILLEKRSQNKIIKQLPLWKRVIVNTYLQLRSIHQTINAMFHQLFALEDSSSELPTRATNLGKKPDISHSDMRRKDDKANKDLVP